MQSMKRYGTNYGGWNIPTDIKLNADSVIYSAGVGEDISFDVLMQSVYNLQVVLIDPTQRAQKHYGEVQNYYATRVSAFTGDIQRDYLRSIADAKPDFSKFTYVNKGLWSGRDSLKFYKPMNEKYVSHTLIEKMYSDNYEVVEVDSLKNIMGSLGHVHIDILKLDIEGSEVVVLNNMLDDGIFPTYICAEFDLKLKNADYNNRTDAILKRLQTCGYMLLKNDDWNCLFYKGT
jgi:FkbM family methyltransferase